MTTTASKQSARALAALAAIEREAWSQYREALRGLEGRGYDDAEPDAWEQLQERLREVAREREELASVAAGGED